MGRGDWLLLPASWQRTMSSEPHQPLLPWDPPAQQDQPPWVYGNMQDKHTRSLENKCQKVICRYHMFCNLIFNESHKKSLLDYFTLIWFLHKHWIESKCSFCPTLMYINILTYSCLKVYKYPHKQPYLLRLWLMFSIYLETV